LPVKSERCISTQRAAQMLAVALGRSYSRQTVTRLVEDGRLRAHRLRPGGWWWIESDSVRELIHRVLTEPPN
jgi:excisionase family DNA binding protein